MNVQKSWHRKYSSWQLLWLGYVSLPLYVGVLVLLLATLTGVWEYKTQLLRPGIVRWLGLVVVLMVGLSAIAHDLAAARAAMVHYLPYFVMFAVILQIGAAVERWQKLAWGLLMASVPVNVFGCVEYVLKAPAVEAVLADQAWMHWAYYKEHYHRAESIFANPNVYADYLVIVLGLELGLLSLGQPRWRQRWLVVALCLTGLGIVCSGSRNGWLVAMSQLVLWLCVSKLRGKVRWLVGAGILSLLGSAIFGGIGTYELTLADVSYSLQHDSRINTWWVAGQLIMARPLLGWGMGSFRFLYPTLNSLDDYLQMSHAHNVGLMLLAEGGVVLLLALALPVGYLCYRGVRSLFCSSLFKFGAGARSEAAFRTRGLLLGYGLALWGLLFFSLFDIPFYDPRINALHWLMMAGVYRLASEGEASAHRERFR